VLGQPLGASLHPQGPLRGRHLHRTQAFTVQWITSFSGLPSAEGPNPPGALGRPSLERRARSGRAMKRAAILRGTRRDVNPTLLREKDRQDRVASPGVVARTGARYSPPPCSPGSGPIRSIARSVAAVWGWSTSAAT